MVDSDFRPDRRPSSRLIRVWLCLLLSFIPMMPAQDPEATEIPDGYERIDDMIVPIGALSGDSVFVAQRWPGGVVPFLFASNITQTQRLLFMEAIAEIEAVANVTFTETASFNVIVIRNNPSVNCPDNCSSSSVGMQGGIQNLNVGTNHWTQKFVLVHELLHALGCLHEQSRVDRDAYITINWQNISQTTCDGSCDHNFQLAPLAIPLTPYDFLSIMHYGPNAFSIGGPTIQCKPSYAQFQNLIGQRSSMSEYDATGLAAVYGAPPGPSATSLTPNSVVEGTSGLTITVRGSRFHRGSFDPTMGIQGSRLVLNGIVLSTTYVDRETLMATIPASQLTQPGLRSIWVRNDPEAGGDSGPVTLTVTQTPCSSTNSKMGYAVAGIGDVNGDGHDDVLVGNPGYSSRRGRLLCYSGATGNALWTITGSGADQDLGYSVAVVGDVDGDGIPDAAVGAPRYQNWKGLVRVVSGANGATLATLEGSQPGDEFGYAVGSAGDINNAGFPDIVVGSPGHASATGRVQVLSIGGWVLATFTGSASDDRFGEAVAGGLDISGDGVPDVVVGAPYNDDAAFNAGKVYGYSGATHALLFSQGGLGGYDYYGSSVCLLPSPGTVARVVVGAPDFGSLFGNQGGVGYAHVIQKLLFGYGTVGTASGTQPGDRLGCSIASAGDLDDDGYSDIIAGAIQHGIGAGGSIGPGYARVVSGRDFTTMAEFSGTQMGGNFGFAVASAGDTDADGVLDVIAGIPFSDFPCPNTGTYAIRRPKVAPESRKLMLTEVFLGNRAAVEITNFSTVYRNFEGWRIVWDDGTRRQSAAFPSTLTLAPGEMAIIREFSVLPVPNPPGATVLDLLPGINTTTQALTVALVTPTGTTADEVRIADLNGQHDRPSAGGRFRGLVLRHATTTGNYAVAFERIWGLDSNSGADWTTEEFASLGFENQNAGPRGTDPLPLAAVRLNEMDDSPDYIELYNAGPTVNLEGWFLRASAVQGGEHVILTPWPASSLLQTNGYMLIGETGSVPAEMPSGTPYVNLAAVNGGNIPWGNSELDCALYDAHGRLVDLFRATGLSTQVVHNHPRAPAHFGDFTGAVDRVPAGQNSFGRNATSTDTNTGDDFRSLSTRTLGAANVVPGQTWTPDPATGLDVRLNGTPFEGALALIVNGGPSRAGSWWSFTFTVGHLNGQGPIFGLGPEAIDHWWALSTIPGFSGTLDARGRARLDLPPQTFPVGFQADTVFFLQNPQGGPEVITRVLELDI